MSPHTTQMLALTIPDWTGVYLSPVEICTMVAAGIAILITIYWKRAIGSHSIPRTVAYGPGALPLLGSALFVMKHLDALSTNCYKYWRSIGMKNFAMSTPGQPLMVFTADPANIEHVTKTRFDNYVKGDMFRDRMADGLGDGIFNTDGHAWWLQRKSVSRIFSEAAFNRFMEEVFTEEMEVLKSRLDKAAAAGAAVDLYALFHRFTFDSFCKLALGLEVNSLKDEGPNPVMDAFDRMTQTMLGRFFLPMWKVMEKITPTGRRMAADIKLVRGTFSKIVREKLDKVKAGDSSALEVSTPRQQSNDPTKDNTSGAVIDATTASSQSNNLTKADQPGVFGEGKSPLDNPVNSPRNGARNSPTNSSRNSPRNQCKDLISLIIELSGSESGSKEILTEKFLVDVVLSMLLAGRDTTAQALSWCFNTLRDHPAVVDKIREEVKGVVAARGENGTERKLTYQEVKKLKYTTATLQESLRVKPVVATDTRLSLKADVLPDGTHIPAGAAVLLGIMSVCRNPAVWGPDAEEFRPERWLEMETQPSSFKYPVFYAGPRTCVGRNMALIEGTYMLAELLSHYNFQLVEGHPVEPMASLTMAMKYGYKVQVQAVK